MERRLYKDAFHDYLIHGREDAVSADLSGTKACGLYRLEVEGGGQRVLRLRLCAKDSPPLPCDQIIALRLREDQFVLYSVGRNGVDDNAAEVTDDASAAQTGDYLIWPPVLSLYRTHLIQTNQLP